MSFEGITVKIPRRQCQFAEKENYERSQELPLGTGWHLIEADQDERIKSEIIDKPSDKGSDHLRIIRFHVPKIFHEYGAYD